MKGREVRDIRRKLGLTQEEFAFRLGVSATTVMNWERDKHCPSPLAQKAMFEFLKSDS